MITAEEFIMQNANGNKAPTPKEVEQWLIEFSKIHIINLKELLAEKIYQHGKYKGKLSEYSELYEDLKNIYPLENIK